MRLKLKVCGLRDVDNIQQVSALNPDYQGFIYYTKSLRFVGNDFVLPVSATAQRVGVFVNESVQNIRSKVKANDLDLVQLHGDETPEMAKELAEQGIAVMKAFSIDDTFNFNVTTAFAAYVKFFLFDTKTKNYGGSGKTFDWALLDKYTGSTPFFLSGGLSSENISAIASIKNLAFYGVDVNSGVEDAPGIKNINKLKELIGILKTI